MQHEITRLTAENLVRLTNHVMIMVLYFLLYINLSEINLIWVNTVLGHICLNTDEDRLDPLSTSILYVTNH